MYESEPLPEVVAAARAHLAKAHELPDFDPECDLTYPGHERSPALVVYLAETARVAAGFVCEICGERSFPVEPSYGHPARNAQLLADHPELWAEVSGLDEAERAIVLEDWDRQRRRGRGQERLRTALRRRGLATKRATRPEVARRIACCQEFLLSAWVELGSQDRAVRALIALADEDPARHHKIVGGRYPMAYETYLSYLKALPAGRRDQAKAERDARLATERAERARGLTR